jgi:hypothetical protein
MIYLEINGSHRIIQDALVGSLLIIVIFLWFLPSSIFVHANRLLSCQRYNILTLNSLQHHLFNNIVWDFWLIQMKEDMSQLQKQYSNVLCCKGHHHMYKIKCHIKCFHCCNVKHELVEGTKYFFWQLYMKCERDGSVSKWMSLQKMRIVRNEDFANAPTKIKSMPTHWHKNHGLWENIARYCLSWWRQS